MRPNGQFRISEFVTVEANPHLFVEGNQSVIVSGSTEMFVGQNRITSYDLDTLSRHFLHLRRSKLFHLITSHAYCIEERLVQKLNGNVGTVGLNCCITSLNIGVNFLISVVGESRYRKKAHCQSDACKARQKMSFHVAIVSR